MIARILTGLVGAAGLVGLVVWGVGAIREDARNDLLRELMLKQIEADAEAVGEREALKEEIENATDQELTDRACRLGLFTDGCPTDAQADTELLPSD